MKTNSLGYHTLLIALIAFFIWGMLANGCKKHDNNSSPTSYQQINLVSDTAYYAANRIDMNLDNPWGIAIGPTGIFWIAVNHNSSTAVYDGNGTQVLPNVGIPLNGDLHGSSPTGVVYNNTAYFIVPSNGMAAKFIYVGEDGTISAWNTGDTTIKVVDRSGAHAIYKGIAMASDGGANFIYAADFYNAKVDVFDQSFNYVSTKPFADAGIPAGFAPFNIQNIGGLLYVTYAKQKGPDNEDDQSGAGNGYVDIYKPDGSLVKRFASQGTLNSPWGIAQAPSAFGQGNGAILIGNFGDGRINIYDANGSYKGQLQNNGTTITIDGLWAITFPQSMAGNLDMNKLYFTAAPSEETYGIFGYLIKK